MSTDWYYRFRAPLRPDLVGLDMPAIRAMAPAPLHDVCFASEPPIEDDMASGPTMGPDTSYDGSRFSGLVGVSTEGGEIRLGIWAQNLERVPIGYADDADVTRLDLLCGFLSWATVGPPGEVVGCIASEHSDRRHADPLIRCADGLVRMCDTDPVIDGGWWEAEVTETVEIPPVVPCDLITVQGDSRADLDCERLRKRFIPIADSAVDLPLA